MCEHNLRLNLCRKVPTCTSFDCLHDVFVHLVCYSPMHQPLIFYSEEEMSITDHLRQAFDNVATSDLTIRVEGKSVHVHKAVLKLRSQYFRSMLQEQCAENCQSITAECMWNLLIKYYL